MSKLPYKIKSEFIFSSAKKGTAINAEILFVCDPKLNTECKKTCCGKECTMTKNIHFAKRFDIDE